MSDDPRPDPDHSLVFKEPTLGTPFKVTVNDPKLRQRAKCCVEVYTSGESVARLEHEPDEELELSMFGNRATRVMEFLTDDALRATDGYFLNGAKLGEVRVCKYCGCLYLERINDPGTKKSDEAVVEGPTD